MSRDTNISATNPLYDEVVEPSQEVQHPPGNVDDDSYTTFVPLQNVQTESNGAAKSEAAIHDHPSEYSGNLVPQQTLPTGTKEPVSLPTEEPISNGAAHAELDAKASIKSSEEVTQQENDEKKTDSDESTAVIDQEPVDSLHPLRKMQEEPPSVPIVHHVPSKKANTMKEESDENSLNDLPQTDQHSETVNEEPAVVDTQHIDAGHVIEEEHHTSSQQATAESDDQDGAKDDVSIEKEELAAAEENEEETFTDIEKEFEAIIPEEDREMYVEAVDSLVTSLERKCCRCYCVDCFNTSCCCSLTCKDPRKILKEGTKTTQIITKDLQIGAQNGWKILVTFIFPLIRPFIRDLITIAFFLISLIGLIFSIISVAMGSHDGCTIFRLVCTAFSTFFSFGDMIISLKYSKSFKEAWRRILARRAERRAANGSGAGVDEKGSYVENSTKDVSIVQIQNRDEPEGLKKWWDVFRLVVLELIFYPLLLCDLIAFIVSKQYRFEVDTANDIFGLIKVLYSFVSKVFFVYILRMVILIAMIYHIYKKRTLSLDQSQRLAEIDRREHPSSSFPNEKPNDIDNEQDEETLNRDIANSGLKFQIYFAFHVAGQMAAQVLMIIAISITVDKENANKAPEDPINISSRLWFMMISGYILPFIGIFSFFIPTFYWTYEHPTGICINVLSLLQKPGFGHIFSFKEKTKGVRAKVIEIAKNLNKSKLKEDFKELRDRAFSDKLFYPFKSPFLVIVCLAYSFTQFAFVLVAILAIRSGDPASVFFYAFSVIVGVAANVYVFAVAALWTAIIAGIIALIALVVFMIFMACALASCGSDERSRRNL